MRNSKLYALIVVSALAFSTMKANALVLDIKKVMDLIKEAMEFVSRYEQTINAYKKDIESAFKITGMKADTQNNATANTITRLSMQSTELEANRQLARAQVSPIACETYGAGKSFTQGLERDLKAAGETRTVLQKRNVDVSAPEGSTARRNQLATDNLKVERLSNPVRDLELVKVLTPQPARLDLQKPDTPPRSALEAQNTTDGLRELSERGIVTEAILDAYDGNAFATGHDSQLYALSSMAKKGFAGCGLRPCNEERIFLVGLDDGKYGGKTLVADSNYGVPDDVRYIDRGGDSNPFLRMQSRNYSPESIRAAKLAEAALSASAELRMYKTLINREALLAMQVANAYGLK